MWWRARRTEIGLVLAGLVLAAVYGATIEHGPALADEFAYLGGARHFAHTARLDARYYDSAAILQRGHPHQDVHTPGYVIVLGAFSKLFGEGYAAAVALNVLAYVGSALLVLRLGRALGAGEIASLCGAALFLLLPAYLPYVFWAMPEVVFGACILGALVAAVARVPTRGLAVLAGSLFGLAFLIRESALFALPALVVVQRRRRTLSAFLVAAASWLLVVYLPLSLHRAPGGANFWAPLSGTAFGYQSVQAARQGALAKAATLAARRAGTNARKLASATWTERGILLAFALIPILALRRHGRRPEEPRAFLRALLAGYVAVVALLFGVYVVGEWSGLRYLMFLVPPLLPFVVSPAPGRGARLLVSALAVWFALLAVGTRAVLDAFKVSRQRRQGNLTAYIEKYLPPGGYQRVVLANGWLFGWRHYPVEVITSLPDRASEIRALEHRVWFDYLVMAGESPLAPEWDQRVRYRRIDTGEAPPLVIYQRLR